MDMSLLYFVMLNSGLDQTEEGEFGYQGIRMGFVFSILNRDKYHFLFFFLRIGRLLPQLVSITNGDLPQEICHFPSRDVCPERKIVYSYRSEVKTV